MRKLISTLLFLPIMASCATPSKSQLDAEVKRLCAIDGGIKVYETVTLPPNRFDNYGNVKILAKEYSKTEDEYFYTVENTYLRTGNPELRRSKYRITRRSDNKILGESVYYSRRGGDMPGPWHESSFSCPDVSSGSSIEKSVFLMEDK